MRRFKKATQAGQGMTEYLLIVALIAITTIAVVRTTGTNLKVGFAKIAHAIAGKDTDQFDADTVTEAQVKKRDMGDFDFGTD